MPTIDLHCHTTASDGTSTPTDLVDLAAQRLVDVIAVTDHDTVAGVAEAQARGEATGVRVVAGIELSTRHEGRGVHMLGLFVDPDDPDFRAGLDRFRSGRLERAKAMVACLRELGYEIDFSDVEGFAGGDVVGRPHIARALVARGYIDSVSDAFTPGLIADGGMAYVGRDELTPTEAVDFVRAAGGVTVVAHPGVGHHLGVPTPVSEGLIAELATAGMAGLEVDHPDHPPQVRDRLRALADRLDLIPTGGSDHHVPDGRLPGAETTSETSLAALESARRGSPPRSTSE